MAAATIQLNPMVMDWTGHTHAHKEYPSGFIPLSHESGRGALGHKPSEWTNHLTMGFRREMCTKNIEAKASLITSATFQLCARLSISKVPERRAEKRRLLVEPVT